MSTITSVDSTVAVKENAFWTAYLSGFDVKSVLPYDGNDYLLTAAHFKSVEFVVDAASSHQILTFSSLGKISTDTLVYSAWTLLLHKYNNSDEVLFGVPNDKGEFIPFVSKLQSEQTLQEFSLYIQNNMYLREPYATAPLDRIRSYSELTHEQSMFDSEISMLQREVNPSPYSFFSINASICNGQLKFQVRYNTHKLKEQTVCLICSHLNQTLVDMVESPFMKVNELRILSESEWEKVLYQFNSRTNEYKSDLTIDQLFEEQVVRAPHQKAVVCGERSLTYFELNEQANQIANILRAEGILPDQRVGLIVERDLELIIGMFAIMKAGAAYLPVDPAFPHDRIRYMFQNGDVQRLLTTSDLNLNLEVDCKQLFLDDETLYNSSKVSPTKIHKPNNLMYVLYTSGSTGQPKGVAVEHRNVSGYVNAFIEEFHISANDKMIQQSTVSFDISVEEIYPILLTGGTLIIARKNEVAEISLLLDVMKRTSATMISGFPLLLNELNKHTIPESMHTFISGGDVLREEYVSNLMKKAKVYNTYGPSETTVCIAYYQVKDNLETSIPTGKPISNYKVYILDRNLKPMPIGAPGEVCISGPGVSREYLNRSDLTSERYVSNPFISGERMFISGDLARWLPDGNIEFLGRIDDQVKIRGRRTEPGEIQRLLLKHGSVSEAFVLARMDKFKNKYLTAYVVGDEILSVLELREHLLQMVPEFMVPSYFVQMDKLPLTPSGKVDKKSLCRVID